MNIHGHPFFYFNLNRSSLPLSDCVSSPAALNVEALSAYKQKVADLQNYLHAAAAANCDHCNIVVGNIGSSVGCVCNSVMLDINWWTLDCIWFAYGLHYHFRHWNVFMRSISSEQIEGVIQ